MIRSSILVVIAFVSLFYIEASDVLITFTSSANTPDIAEGDTAVYNCTSNHSSVTVTWFFNTTVSASSLTSLGVMFTGTGTTVSTLSVPGLIYPFNNTEILCFAAGPGIDVSPPPVILRVQGPPGAVVDISIIFSSCTYYISWTAPFTLSGFPILQYNINVTNGRTVYKTNVTVTEWNYNPVEFGNYSISIAAVNSVGEGERSTTNLEEKKYAIKNVTCAGRYRHLINSINYWIIVLHIEVSTVTDLLDCIGLVTIACVDTAVTANTSNITMRNNQLLIATLNTSLLDDKYHTFTMNVSHDNHQLQVSYNNSFRLSFFDVSNFSILSIESNTVTFMCDFVRGSQAIGCHISLNDSLLNETYSINITREIKTGSISVPAGNYSVSVFDINENNKSAAFTSTVVSVTATMSTVFTMSSSPSPSPSQTTIDGNVTATDTPDMINGAVVPVISVLAVVPVIVMILIMTVIVYTYSKKIKGKETRRDKKVSPSQHDVRLVHLNYIDIAHDNPDAPMAPPTFDPNPAPYSDVIVPHQREQNVNEGLYDQQLVTGNNSQLYSTLNHNSQQIVTTSSKAAGTDLYSKLNYSSETSAPTTCTTTISDVDYLPNSELEHIIQTKLTHRALSEHVAPHLTNKWHEVGLALALTPPQLDDIEENHQGISDVFQMWEDLETRPFNWETLLTILRSSGVNECELADKLERQLI